MGTVMLVVKCPAETAAKAPLIFSALRTALLSLDSANAILAINYQRIYQQKE